MSTSNAAQQGASVLDSLITPDDLAARLDISKRTLGYWRERGSGPRYVRLGHRVGYLPDDVDEWLLLQRRSSTAEERG